MRQQMENHLELEWYKTCYCCSQHLFGSMWHHKYHFPADQQEFIGIRMNFIRQIRGGKGTMQTLLCSQKQKVSKRLTCCRTWYRSLMSSDRYWSKTAAPFFVAVTNFSVSSSSPTAKYFNSQQDSHFSLKRDEKHNQIDSVNSQVSFTLDSITKSKQSILLHVCVNQYNIGHCYYSVALTTLVYTSNYDNNLLLKAS